MHYADPSGRHHLVIDLIFRVVKQAPARERADAISGRMGRLVIVPRCDLFECIRNPLFWSRLRRIGQKQIRPSEKDRLKERVVIFRHFYWSLRSHGRCAILTHQMLYVILRPPCVFSTRQRRLTPGRIVKWSFRCAFIASPSQTC